MTGAESTRRLFATGLAIIGLVAVVRGAINVGVHRLPEAGGSGLVLGSDSLPVAGAPVFLSLGDGSLERLTTDATGLFRIRLERSEYQHASLLICVPGGMPYVAHPVENLRTPAQYQITTRPLQAIVAPSIGALGWRHLIPRECLLDWIEQ